MTAISRMRSLGVAWCCLVCLPIHAAAQDLAQPQLVREVLAGTRDEARVSWWGFDAEDSTRFLQDAIQSKARKLIIDRQATPWITRHSRAKHQEIILEEGVELVAKKGEFDRKAIASCHFGDARTSPSVARRRLPQAGTHPHAQEGLSVGCIREIGMAHAWSLLDADVCWCGSGYRGKRVGTAFTLGRDQTRIPIWT